MQDIRKALDDKNLDAVSIATPNHWHSLMTIWACQAGKDVYVEKPMSHNVFEGRTLRRSGPEVRPHRAARHAEPQQRRHGPARSPPSSRASTASCWSRKGYCCKPRWSIGRKPISHAAGGPRFQPLARPGRRAAVPRQPGPLQLALVLGFRQRRHRQPGRPRDGRRPLGHQGRHAADKVWSLGGRFGYEDQGQTPNTQMAVLDFGDVLLVFEVRGLVDKPREGLRLQVQGDQRVLHDRRHDRGRQVLSRRAAAKPEKLARFDVEGDARAARSAASSPPSAAARSEDLNADAEVGHYSSALCHLANISYRLGEKVPFNGKTKTLGDNREVVETFRTCRTTSRASASSSTKPPINSAAR